MSDDTTFTIEMRHKDRYAFEVRFDGPGMAALALDEPAPMGTDSGPNASRLVAAAAANCLSASLMFCLAKQDVAPHAVVTRATGRIGRNDKGRFRIVGLDVAIALEASLAQSAKLAACLGKFEDFCTVTASLRQGIPIQVTVTGPDGAVLHRS